MVSPSLTCLMLGCSPQTASDSNHLPCKRLSILKPCSPTSLTRKLFLCRRPPNTRAPVKWSHLAWDANQQYKVQTQPDPGLYSWLPVLLLQTARSPQSNRQSDLSSKKLGCPTCMARSPSSISALAHFPCTVPAAALQLGSSIGSASLCERTWEIQDIRGSNRGTSELEALWPKPHLQRNPPLQGDPLGKVRKSGVALPWLFPFNCSSLNRVKDVEIYCWLTTIAHTTPCYFYSFIRASLPTGALTDTTALV